MEPQGWRIPPLAQSTRRIRTAVLNKTTRTESANRERKPVQSVGLDARKLPCIEPLREYFLLTSPFIGPSGTASALYGIKPCIKLWWGCPPHGVQGEGV
jgi:hypothetical protein